MLTTYEKRVGMQNNKIDLSGSELSLLERNFASLVEASNITKFPPIFLRGDILTVKFIHGVRKESRGKIEMGENDRRRLPHTLKAVQERVLFTNEVTHKNKQREHINPKFHTLNAENKKRNTFSPSALSTGGFT